jgi:exodeoxyribonuclease VII small subunit
MADNRESELDSTSFNKNYAIRKETADWLAGQQEPDIDLLMPKVEQAIRAYAICKERLDAEAGNPGLVPPAEGRDFSPSSRAYGARSTGTRQGRSRRERRNTPLTASQGAASVRLAASPRCVQVPPFPGGAT